MSMVTPMLIPGFRGPLLGPESDGYEQARRVWNAAIDRRPAMIARCIDTGDVAAALRYARAHDLDVAVRGGGHSQAGFSTCTGGLVVDLSPMRGIRVDPDACTATVQPGATWGELDAATQAHGLALPGGEVTDTGVAGLTLGGGIGWLTRMHGLTCDNLLGVDIVTAAGELLPADRETHSDLFWALRGGGGGNFGVVTEFRFRLHPVGEVLAGPILYPADAAPEVLRAVQELAPTLPNEMALNVVLATMPPTPDTPPPLQGARTLLIVPAWFGSPVPGRMLIDDLRGARRAGASPAGPRARPCRRTCAATASPAGRWRCCSSSSTA